MVFVGVFTILQWGPLLLAVGSPVGTSVTNDSSIVAHFFQLHALVFFRA